jgi:hypothetical protein
LEFRRLRQGRLQQRRNDEGSGSNPAADTLHRFLPFACFDVAVVGRLTGCPDQG